MIEVVGGPFSGQQVREVATVETNGHWIADRYYLCRPVGKRGTPKSSYPYELRDGRYIWIGDEGKSE